MLKRHRKDGELLTREGKLGLVHFKWIYGTMLLLLEWIWSIGPTSFGEGFYRYSKTFRNCVVHGLRVPSACESFSLSITRAKHLSATNHVYASDIRLYARASGMRVRSPAAGRQHRAPWPLSVVPAGLRTPPQERERAQGQGRSRLSPGEL